MSLVGSDIDIEAVVDLEQKFYDTGYADGLAHGRIHGLIEGRALGRQKGFDLWEELGFYEGFAKVWKMVGQRNGGSDERTFRLIHNADFLLDLIANFPRINQSEAEAEGSGPDILKLASQIRSRYKMLCVSVGVQPSLRAGIDGGSDENEIGVNAKTNTDAKASRSTSNPLWRLEKKPNQGLSF